VRFAAIDLAPQDDGRWVSLSGDPQAVVRLGFFRPAYCLFFLDGEGTRLDPILYFDGGQGFTESTSSTMSNAGPTVYIVPLHKARGLHGLRFDPASRTARFRFWFKPIYRPGKLNAVLAGIFEKASIQGAPLPKCITIVPPSRALLRSSGSRSVSAHYNHVLSLAESVRKEAIAASSDQPLISLIVPTYNTPKKYLDDLVRSFEAQRSGVAELILTDDGSTAKETLSTLERLDTHPSIKYLPHRQNTGIALASNRGIAAASGRWLGLLDHDDALSPFALDCILAALGRHPDALLFYTDEVIADKDLKPIDYILKPAFDPVLLSGVNYLNHLSLYRLDRVIAKGCLRPGFEGSQDYDLLLRYIEGLEEKDIVHVPFPAYLWRRTPSAFSAKFVGTALDSARRALALHYEPGFGSIPVDPTADGSLHRVRLDAAIKTWPSVSVIIPNRDSFALISRVLHDLLHNTDYPDLEIIVVDNGTTDHAVLELYERFRGGVKGFRAELAPAPFNFAQQVNRGIALATKEHILLLNNDIEVVSSDWLREMVSCLRYRRTGIVGAKLLYRDGTLQHAGVIVGYGGLAGHWFERKDSCFPGPFGRLRVRQTLSAVTGACMLISRQCINAIGQLDAQHFAIAYNDVDYCLRAARAGFRTVWTPFAELVHHESASRGSDETEQNVGRFNREKAFLRALHGTDEFEDPAFSPWYTKHRSEPNLTARNTLPGSRTGRG
jgi:GT2 family glycosyltransferase